MTRCAFWPDWQPRQTRIERMKKPAGRADARRVRVACPGSGVLFRCGPAAFAGRNQGLDLRARLDVIGLQCSETGRKARK